MKLSLAKFRRYPAPVRILGFTLILLMLWLPIALPLQLLVPAYNWVGTLILVILYVEFIWLVRLWGRQVHRQPHIFWTYGLDISRHSRLDLLIGLGIGLMSVLVLISVESLLGWVEWRSPSMEIGRIILEGLLTSLAIGFAEELLFRGWLLDELQRDYVPVMALWANAILFAVIHFRLFIFPSMVLLGLTLVWAKRSRSETLLGKRSDRLALPIGLHAGLVWGNYMLLDVGKLIQYTDRVPTWVTGIDRNPLAGIVGVLFLGILAFSVRRYAATRRT